MAKPAGVKNLTAMFQNPGDTTTSKTTPEVKPKPAGRSPLAKPVAVVSPSTQSNSDVTKPGTTKTGGWKPPVKPPVSPNKVNGAIKINNNNDSKFTNSDQSNGVNQQTSKSIPGTDRVSKLNIPNAFSKSTDTSPKSASQIAQNNATSQKPPELSQLKSSLRPVGGVNSKMTSISNSYTSKNSLNRGTASSVKSPASPPEQDPDIVLSCDKKKFKLKNKTQAIRFPGKLPAKPAKLEHVDFTSIISSIPPTLPSRLPPRPDKSLPVEEEEGEIYDDVDNTPIVRPVSEIQEYTEEEEEREISGGRLSLEQETYDDADTAPQLPTRSYPPKHSPSVSGGGETYDDCAITEGVAEVEGEMEELYEALDELQPSATSSPTDAKKEEEKKREQERREKKEKDKKDKEEKEKQKKLEKEKKKEKDLLAKFKITGEEVAIADGKVKENAKGGKSDLAVKKGESVSILRMTDNPQYRWLAKTQDGKIGYVEIKNIEIMTGTLQNAKNEALKMSTSGEPGETYDDVATLDEPDQDIYEESM